MSDRTPMQNLVDYVSRLNLIRRVAGRIAATGGAAVYFTLKKATPPTGFRIHLGDKRGPIGEVCSATVVQPPCFGESEKPSAYWAITVRFRPVAVVAWCQKEAERISE